MIFIKIGAIKAKEKEATVKAIVKEKDVATKPIPKDKDTRPIDDPHI